MESSKNKLQPVQQGITSTISKDHVKLVSGLFLGLNDLVAFKMTGPEIESWATDVLRLCPQADLEKLPFLIDCFKTEAIEFDKTKGIQNIFRGLKQIIKTEKGFEVLKPMW